MIGALLSYQCLGKEDRPRDCLAEKGMPSERPGKKDRPRDCLIEKGMPEQGRGNMRVCLKRAMS